MIDFVIITSFIVVVGMVVVKRRKPELYDSIMSKLKIAKMKCARIDCNFRFKLMGDFFT